MNLKNSGSRLLYCLLGWGTVGIVYHFTEQVTDRAVMLSPSFIDNRIPFSANSVWLYFSFFIFIPIGYLFSANSRAKPLMFSMQLCAVFSGVIYMLFPTTMSYPAAPCLSFSEQALCDLVRIDSPQNLLPSLHVSLTLVVLNALWMNNKKWHTAAYLLWAIAICASVLILKRHLLIDVVAGAITAVIAVYFVHFVQTVIHRLGEKSSE